MPFYVYAWIACVSSGFILVISKLASKRSIKNPWLFNFLWTLVTVVFVIPLGIINHSGFPHEWLSIVAAALTSVLWYVAFILSMYRLDVSTISPMFNFRTIFAVALGALFLHEGLSSYQFWLFLVIVVSGMFATIDEKFDIRSFFTPAIGISLASMFFLAVNNALIKVAIAHNGLWTTNVWMGILSLVFVCFTYPLFKNDIRSFKKEQVAPVITMGALQTITNFALASALAVNVGVTSLIMSIPISMVLAVSLSVIFPKLLESHTLKVYVIRFTATAIMIVSALQLSK
jgi:drug/metabolite transporter (DMT)-like permease